MLITEKVKIEIHNRNITKFKNKFGNKIDVEIGIIEVPVEYLSKGSHETVDVKCDICNKDLKMEWRSYLKYFKNNNLICCKNCNNIKVRKTMLEKYGVVCNSQIKENKEKVSEKWKNKSDEQINEIREKHVKYYREKYDVDFYVQTDECKEKYKQTCIERYDVENISQLEYIKEKVVKSKIEKFGCINNSQLEGFKEICRQTRIMNGFERSEEEITKFERYRKDIKNKTRVIKKDLLNDWNGYDYYDNEYIKENFNLNPLDKNYPTIDHKKSIHYCFDNNIPVDECACLENLCITKKFINSSKGKNCKD